MDHPQRGLLGGSGAMWLEKGLSRPHFESPLYLDAMSSKEDADALRAFLQYDPLEIEIGCGRGHFIEEMARSHPARRFLVIEARGRYVRMALKRLERLGVDNVRVVHGDARELLPALVSAETLRAVYLLFPDPWWKKRHVKKRVATPAFFGTIRDRLMPGGVLVFRSDVEAYVERVDALIETMSGYQRRDGIPEGVARSHRHKKCVELGIPIWERGFMRVEEGVKV